MDISILYEDEQVCVIDKPVGVVVNKARTVKGETIQDWAAKKFSIFNFQFSKEDKESDFYKRSGIVHRIDKETSGILILAKTPESFNNLQGQFKERLIKKVYIAIVHGKLVPSEGEINAPIGRLPWNRERFGVVAGGKEALTKYKVHSSQLIVHSKRKIQISIVEVYPYTGRTHQIRVHMKYINHPIVGDYLYAGRKTARRDRNIVGRVMLHAARIKFVHPVTNKTIAIKSPMPDDMNRIINSKS
ncbi:RluA family pseudouridine synthase [Patescibacteria group bacterium]